jgi:hypothetical protein
MASSVSGSSGQTPNEGANTSTVVGYGSVTITNGYYDGLSSTARVTINGVNYDQAGPGSMSQGQTYTWNYPVSFGHNANGERAAIGVSVAFYVNGASFHDGSAGAGTQGALNYDRSPSDPTFASTTRSGRSIAVTVNAVSSPASTAQYSITRSQDGGGYGDARTSSTRGATYASLALGSTQRFQVVVSNSDGSSSTATSGLTSIPNVPGSPSVSVSAPTARNRTVTAGVSPDNGATVTRYWVAASSDNGATWFSAVTMDGSRQYTFTGLTPGGVYKFRVFSENEMGNSAFSTSESYTIPTVPDPPTVSATTPSGRKLTVSAGVSDSGGATVTGYFVQSSLDEGTTWSSPQSLTVERTFAFSDLRGGATYLFRVYSTNEVGPSEFTTTNPIFVTSGGRRWDGSAWVPVTIFKRWTGSAWVDVTIAKRWTGSVWADLS